MVDSLFLCAKGDITCIHQSFFQRQYCAGLEKMTEKVSYATILDHNAARACPVQRGTFLLDQEERARKKKKIIRAEPGKDKGPYVLYYSLFS